jgi:hypothetical protein
MTAALAVAFDDDRRVTEIFLRELRQKHNVESAVF